MRHAAMVPKGFLRYQLLKKLNQKPMSGSEIMSELENETTGYWRPSPGSIYPLLAWLQDQKLIRETEQTEPGIRRYTLTDAGKAFLETEMKSRDEINKHMQNLGNMWYGLSLEHRGVTGKVAHDFFRASRDLHHELKREHSKERLEEAKKALEEVTKQIEEITKKLQA
jgi:DNA-binding PadR family transcriptional regulator